jgi:hypothetical protein
VVFVGQEEAGASMRLGIHQNVDHVTVLKTPQFYMLWAAVMGNACAGMSVLSTAKNLTTDIFGVAFPAIVTGAFAANYVASLSGSNAAGRLGWSAASDYLGRKNTYYLFATAIPIYASVPYVTDIVGVADPITGQVSTTPLYLFCGSMMLGVRCVADR